MKRVYFTENEIPYSQDFSFKRGIPPFIIFEIEDAGLFSTPENIRLKAPGYGVSPNYGNGSICVNAKDLKKNKAVRWMKK